MKGKVELIVGCMFAGKCFGKGTRVLTYDGTSKNIEDLQIGDTLIGDDNKPVKVISTNTGNGNLYQITTSKGVINHSYIANEDHVLCLTNKEAYVEVPLINAKMYLERGFHEYKILVDNENYEFKLDRIEYLTKCYNYFKTTGTKPTSETIQRVAYTANSLGLFIDMKEDDISMVSERCPITTTITPSGIGDYYGIIITGNGKFLLETCIVVHNTTELIRRLKRFKIGGKKCLVIKHENDKRYSVDEVSTHDLVKMKSVPVNDICEYFDTHQKEIEEYDVIGIDEGQFFKDIDLIADKLANLGKTVIISALDGDFQRNGFGDIPKLYPKCETLTKLSAVCSICGNEAQYSKRIVDGQEVKLIGGKESYVAVCRDCYFK